MILDFLGLSDSYDLHGSNIPQGLYVPQDLDDLVQMINKVQMVNIVQMIHIIHLIRIVHLIFIVHMIHMIHMNQTILGAYKMQLYRNHLEHNAQNGWPISSSILNGAPF